MAGIKTLWTRVAANEAERKRSRMGGLNYGPRLERPGDRRTARRRISSSWVGSVCGGGGRAGSPGDSREQTDCGKPERPAKVTGKPLGQQAAERASVHGDAEFSTSWCRSTAETVERSRGSRSYPSWRASRILR